MVLSVTSVVSWRSVLLMEDTGVSGEKPTTCSVASQTLSHDVVLSTLRHEHGSNSQLKW